MREMRFWMDQWLQGQGRERGSPEMRMRDPMNWNNPAEVHAYKAGWSRGFRVSTMISIHATPLAQRVMFNEITRDRQRIRQTNRKLQQWKKKPKNVGNEEWKALATHSVRRSDIA